jgi:DNA-3-methyladenine glycosylase I
MLTTGKDGKKRCFWGQEGKEFYGEYHDIEWGHPVFHDSALFEILTLEGAQAGLSFETVLKKREQYRKAFFNFDIQKVASLSDKYLEKCLEDPGLIRHRGKIFSTRKNAQVILQIDSFSDWLWEHIDHTPIVQRLNSPISSSPLSETISKKLKKRGMTFVGPTIIYAFLQAAGLINDHLKGCHLG